VRVMEPLRTGRLRSGERMPLGEDIGVATWVPVTVVACAAVEAEKMFEGSIGDGASSAFAKLARIISQGAVSVNTTMNSAPQEVVVEFFIMRSFVVCKLTRAQRHKVRRLQVFSLALEWALKQMRKMYFVQRNAPVAFIVKFTSWMLGDRDNRNLSLRRTVTPEQSIRAWSAILNIRLKDTFVGRIRTFNGVVRMCLQTRMFGIFQQQPYAFFNLLK
jgi:hypothetical protein